MIMKTEELTTEELLFAAKWNLPLFANQYSEIERMILKEKAHKDKIRRNMEIENRKRRVLFGE